MKDVEKIKPTGLFTNYIFKAIPLAFDESLSYYECLCGLLSYLKETVIPTVNNNVDAIIEVQNLMTQLQNYVDNYFTNLDVQNEINNKLDEMVNDGSLTKLIKNYIDPIQTEFENTINRIDAVANPRQLERVPAGSEFKFVLVYNLENLEEAEEDFLNISMALKLLQMDYIGGSGTRGYGKVKNVFLCAETYSCL